MKHKVGDKVRIKSLDWYNVNKDKNGEINCENGNYCFTRDMARYCGQVATIVETVKSYNKYHLDITADKFGWEDYMFEDRLYDYAYRAIENREHNEKIIEYLKSLGGINLYELKGDMLGHYYFINTIGCIDFDTLDTL